MILPLYHGWQKYVQLIRTLSNKTSHFVNDKHKHFLRPQCCKGTVIAVYRQDEQLFNSYSPEIQITFSKLCIPEHKELAADSDSSTEQRNKLDTEFAYACDDGSVGKIATCVATSTFYSVI
jgi:hypothetical protein